jgi:hypothetical protein
VLKKILKMWVHNIQHHSYLQNQLSGMEGMLEVIKSNHHLADAVCSLPAFPFGPPWRQFCAGMVSYSSLPEGVLWLWKHVQSSWDRPKYPRGNWQAISDKCWWTNTLIDNSEKGSSHRPPVGFIFNFAQSQLKDSCHFYFLGLTSHSIHCVSRSHCPNKLLWSGYALEGLKLCEMVEIVVYMQFESWFCHFNIFQMVELK